MTTNESQALPLSARNKTAKATLMFAFFAAVGLITLLGLRVMDKMAPPMESGLAPLFELKTFDGQMIRLSDLRGKVVAVNFWASWCQPCREEAPFLEAAWRKYKDRGFVLIGVDYVDTEAEARAYMKEFDLTYPNGPDIQTRISQAYRMTGVPETYFITKDGKLLSGQDATGRAYANWIGPITKAALEERIEKSLAE